MPRPKSPTSVAVKVVLDVSDDTPSYYVNVLEIAHSRHDFSLVAARVPAKTSVQKLELAKQTGEMRVEPERQLVVPPTVIPSLIRALTIQRASYEQKYGVLPDEEEQKNG
jgi:hypothetical protein